MASEVIPETFDKPMSVEDAGHALEGILSDSILGESDDEPRRDAPAAREEPEEVETEEVEPEAQAEPGDGAEETAPEEEDDAPPISTLSEWAEAAEQPLEVLLGLKHTVKADGEEREVTISDLIDGYQKGINYDRKASDLAAKRREFTSRQLQEEQQLQQARQETAERIQLAGSILLEDIHEMDRAIQAGDGDPNELYVAKMRLDQRLGALRQQAQQVQAQQIQAQSAALQRRLEMERELLTDRIPDWGPKHAEKVTDALRRFDLTEQEIGSIVDHRFLRLAHALVEAETRAGATTDRGKKAAELADKVKREVPAAPPKPKKPASKAQLASAANARIAKRLKETGKVEDAAALIESKFSRLLGG